MIDLLTAMLTPPREAPAQGQRGAAANAPAFGDIVAKAGQSVSVDPDSPEHPAPGHGFTGLAENDDDHAGAEAPPVAVAPPMIAATPVEGTGADGERTRAIPAFNGKISLPVPRILDFANPTSPVDHPATPPSPSEAAPGIGMFGPTGTARQPHFASSYTPQSADIGRSLPAAAPQVSPQTQPKILFDEGESRSPVTNPGDRPPEISPSRGAASSETAPVAAKTAAGATSASEAEPTESPKGNSTLLPQLSVRSDQPTQPPQPISAALTSAPPKGAGGRGGIHLRPAHVPRLVAASNRTPTTVPTAPSGVVESAPTHRPGDPAAPDEPAADADFGQVGQGSRLAPEAAIFEHPRRESPREYTADVSIKPSAARPPGLPDQGPERGPGTPPPLKFTDAAPVTTGLFTTTHAGAALSHPVHALEANVGAGMARSVADQLVATAPISGKTRIEIRLHPAELGRLTVHLLPSDGSITASFTAERTDVADLLRRHGDIFRRDLATLGYDNVSLDFGSGGRNQRSFEQMPAALAPDAPDNTEMTGPAPAVPTANSRARMLEMASAGGLDIRL